MSKLTIHQLSPSLFSKMIQWNENSYFFDIQKDEFGENILRIVKTDSNCHNCGDITLLNEEIEIIISTISELKNVLTED